MAFPELTDKKITLIGCGAIGGYAAQALVRLGAGAGLGRLTLIDYDTLKPDNLGRHYLGYPYLMQAKATALQNQLQTAYPFANVLALARCASTVPNLFDADLVIQATGEEQLSDVLNCLRLELIKMTSKTKKQPSGRAPLVHIWVKGNGEAVQGLWTDTTDYGCFRCLRLPDAARTERFPLLKTEAHRQRLGCAAFTPYAVAAPMSATSLLIDMVTDWLKGCPSPRFRTRAIEAADIWQVKNQNLMKLKDCPACTHI